MIFVALLILFTAAKWSAGAENDKTETQETNIWNSTKTKVVIVGSVISAVIGISLLGIIWHRWRKKIRTPLHMDYPAYGITGPSKLNSAIDSKLAQGAQMFHYEQRKQLFTQEKTGDQDKSADSEEEEEEAGNSYSVFECPGLAETGEMEVQNPMFVESKESK